MADGQDIADANLAADVEADDGGILEQTARAPRRALERWGMVGTMLGLIAALAIVSFILVMILWFRGESIQGSAKKVKNTVCALKKEMAGRGGLTYGPSFSVVMTPLALSTGGTQQLFLSAAMPVGVTPVTSAQSGTGSYEPAIYDGEIRGLSAQLPATLSTGTVTFTVTVDRVATALAVPVDSTNGPIVAMTACPPICFRAGQLIGISMTYTTGAASPAALFTPTVRPLMMYKACAPKPVRRCPPKRRC